ncbi:hypothetical protein GE061_017864 [Apolygus lucorum]|uniref:t-SNARE coiled-coil homology domain-containing protein n=1 Tax=Apolygus lucorum TaxID=248454 RepID=A0A8S9XEA9_APOLU|nr:hypothetical protein GE061_017864 [Apolygus lucorum]
MQLRQGASIKKKGSLRASGERKQDEEMVVLNIQGSNAVITKSSKSKEHNELSAVFTKVREITELIESMKENIVLLRKIHVSMQHSPRIDSKTKERGEELNEMIKISCMAARKKIKELKPTSTKKDPKTPQSAVNRVRLTQYSLLVKMLQDAVEEYEKSLDAHKQFSEEMIKKQLHIANVEVTDDELMAMLDSQDLAVFVQDYMRETSEAMQSLQDAKDRHKEIIALEKNIEQLRDMMVEISVNIHQQGDMVDSIEYHIGNGVMMTQHGQKKLSKAHKLMQRARKKKICIAICLTSVLGVLILYMALYITMSQR